MPALVSPVLFEEIDTDKSGSIDYRELTIALKKAQRQAVIDAATKPPPPVAVSLYRKLPDHIHLSFKVGVNQQGAACTNLELDKRAASTKYIAKPWAKWEWQTRRPKHALIIVNVQNDHIDGSLALRYCPAGEEGYEVVPVINAIRKSGRFDVVAVAKDWHPSEHSSFYESMTGKTIKTRPKSATGAERTKALLEARQAAAADIAAERTEIDEVGTGEEDFGSGMRRNAMEYDAHDVDGDQKLDFNEFCAMVREREEGDHTESELKERFKVLDADGSGQVDMNEYVRFSLCDALSRASTRVVDLFKQWDEDGSGQIDKKEFRRAIKSMGFDFFANDAEMDMVFIDFDTDKSGTISYRELNAALRSVKMPPQRALRKTTAGGKKSKYAFKSTVTLDMNSNKSVQDQLRELLAKHSVRIIDLFKDWDDDGNGQIDKKEFRKAIASLGVAAPRAEVDALFDTFDGDRSGEIDYKEVQKALAPMRKKLAKGKQGQPALTAPLHKSQSHAAAEATEVFDEVLLEAPDGSAMPSTLFPRHCVQFTWGSRLHPELITDEKDLSVVLGTTPRVASYSAFHDRRKYRSTGLLAELRQNGVTHVYVCGLAFDCGVLHTALHAAEAGFVTTVVEDACRCSDTGRASEAREVLKEASVEMVRSLQLASHTDNARLKTLISVEQKVPAVKKLLERRRDAAAHGRHAPPAPPKPLSPPPPPPKPPAPSPATALITKSTQVVTPLQPSTTTPAVPQAAPQALPLAAPLAAPTNLASATPQPGSLAGLQAAQSSVLPTAPPPASDLLQVHATAEIHSSPATEAMEKLSSAPMPIVLTEDRVNEASALSGSTTNNASAGSAVTSAQERSVNQFMFAAPVAMPALNFPKLFLRLNVSAVRFMGEPGTQLMAGLDIETSQEEADFSWPDLPDELLQQAASSGVAPFGGLDDLSQDDACNSMPKSLPNVKTLPPNPRHADGSDALLPVRDRVDGRLASNETDDATTAEALATWSAQQHDEKLHSTLFHDLSRSLPPHMRMGTNVNVDWDSYAAARNANARHVGPPSIAWAGNDCSDVRPAQVRMSMPANGRLRTRMPPKEVSLLPDINTPRQVEAVNGRMRISEVLSMARNAVDEDEALALLQIAAARHRRQAEVAHAAGIVNPKLARLDVERALNAHEKSAYGNGGLKKARRLRESEAHSFAHGMVPHPPHRGRKKKDRRSKDTSVHSSTYSAYPSASGVVGSVSTVSGVGSGVGNMFSERPVDMMMQPMPRFGGAGPVINRSAMRSREPQAYPGITS